MWVQYKNGNYTVMFNANTGTKIRMNDLDCLIPEFAENCDVQLTNKCNQGCKYCYANCSPTGKHADIMNQKWIHTLHPYTELAINGNDMDHPQLLEFLTFLKEKKVFANITVNQNQFTDNIDMIKKLSDDGLLYGIGVSLLHATDDFITSVKQFDKAVIHTINGIVSEQDLKKLANNDLKLLILGYKSIGRGATNLEVTKCDINSKMKMLYDTLPYMIDDEWFKVISFDNLALEQLNVKRCLSDEKWNEFYMGGEGQYTYFIDSVNETFSESSLSSEDVRYPLLDSVDEMFNVVRSNSK